ncbi:PREDICTED: SH2 domain-containing adapter protein F-like [Charadrius vociferus]|uniref:SH2 domain-containing adapter protein F-like n=1 Tax=Charadrius vociferus TaxID=50402 RepID=UPI0005219552|nr:PREDICTED: SH2 domain-containing adapter protein F-like [Charadrius vociferus]
MNDRASPEQGSRAVPPFPADSSCSPEPQRGAGIAAVGPSGVSKPSGVPASSPARPGVCVHPPPSLADTTSRPNPDESIEKTASSEEGIAAALQPVESPNAVLGQLCPNPVSSQPQGTTCPSSAPPWEWKKDHISRAFAVQFESPERSPSLSRQLPRSPRPTAGARLGCPPSPRHVDTSLPLEKQAWYHGPIGRAGAETLLALCREGSFLVRDCETSPDDYSLSLRHGVAVVGTPGQRGWAEQPKKNGKQILGLARAGAPFPSVPEAVRHYTARALPVRGARHLSLLYPVAAQPL